MTKQRPYCKEFDEVFRGDRAAARKRLREVVEQAIATLPTTQMNGISYTITAHIESQRGLKPRTLLNAMCMDLKTEQRALGRRRGMRVSHTGGKSSASRSL